MHNKHTQKMTMGRQISILQTIKQKINKNK